MAKSHKLEFNMINLLHGYTSSDSLRSSLSGLVKTPEFKDSFAKKAIETILARTVQDNIDKNGRPFKSYSKSYINSKVFKDAGKSRTRVNLTLSGDMLSSISTFDPTRQKVVLGFSDQDQNDKADGHITGRATGKIRDFFGIPKNDQNLIFREVIREFNGASNT